MNLGIIAHNSKKVLIEDFCIAYKNILAKHEVYATGTTGRRIEEATNLHVHKFLAGSIGGDKQFMEMVERQDLEEMAGNLIDNAAKYGGGRVFVTVGETWGRDGAMIRIQVEDDGRGIPLKQREAMFERGTRLDTGMPGTGLGLAIVRDVAAIYGGNVRLLESEDLGGLMAVLTLPAAAGPAPAPA